MVRQLGKGAYCAVTIQECTCITLDCSFLSHRVPPRACVLEHSRSTLSSVCCNLFDIVCQYVGSCLVDVDARDDQLADRVALPCIPIFHSSLLSCHTVNTPTFERCLCPKEVDTLRFKNEIWNRVAGDLCRIRRMRTVPSHIILYNLITCMQSAIGTFLQFSCMYALWRIHPVCFSPMGYSASLAWYWLTWKSALGIVLSCRLSWRRTTHNGSRTGDQSLHVDLEVLIYLYLILLAWKKQQARRILAISTQFNTSSQ